MCRHIFLLLLAFLMAGGLSAQYPSIEWYYDLDDAAYGSAATADIDGDSLLEIVFTTYRNDGFVYALNGEDGSLLWKFDIGGCGDVAPIIYDVDLDGELEVVVIGSCNPYAWSIDGLTGMQEWKVYSGGGDSPPVIADVDKDNKPEVLFGNFSSEVRCLNGENGSTAWMIDVDDGPIQSAPALLDINNDGWLDVIFANWSYSDNFRIFALDGLTRTLIWEDTMPSDFTYHAGPVADLDLDGKAEYVIGCSDGVIRAYNTEDGSILWSRAGLVNVIGAFTVADLDMDDTLEVIYINNDYQTFNDHIGILSGYDGSTEWSYPLGFNKASFRGVAISDVNGDGVLDMVSGHDDGKLRVVDANGSLVWDLDLAAHYGVSPFWIDHGPLIADFDGDGLLDVFVVGGYGVSSPTSDDNYGRAYMVKAGVGTCPEWRMFRQDHLRTGYLSAADIAEGCDTTSTAIAAPSLLENNVWISPNPFSESVDIRVRLQENSSLEIEVLDLKGQKIASLFEGKLRAGELLLQWNGDSQDGKAIPTGLYLIRFRTDTGLLIKKIIRL